ncbi:MAG: hypothetical protein ABWY63_13930 [Hyphomicrobiaceae bacterium]|jgi:hypothetical protein
MRIAERLLVCLAVFIALVPPAQTQEAQAREQSVPLSQIVKVGRDTPDLLRQIDVELRRNNLKEGDVSCMAAPLGGPSKPLGGGGGAPYQCQFGDRTLRIEADRAFFDGRGKRLGQTGEAPETMPERARSFRENNLRWFWAPEFPR